MTIWDHHLILQNQKRHCRHSCQCVLLTIISLDAFNWAITLFYVPLCSASSFLSEESLYSAYMLTMLTIRWDVCACAWLLLAYVEGWEYLCQVWWLTSLVPILRRLSQQDCYKFKARLGYIVSSKPTKVKDPVFKEKEREKEKKRNRNPSALPSTTFMPHFKVVGTFRGGGGVHIQ